MIGLCLADPRPEIIHDGGKRTISATHFAGRYRLVDFMLSNMVNSGISSVAMILNSQYQSLVTHIGTGKEWDLSRKSGGVTLFPPYYSEEPSQRRNEPDEALQRALAFVGQSRAEYVVLAECSTLLNMDFRALLAVQNKTGADIVAAYGCKTVLPMEQAQTVTYDVAGDGRLIGIMTSAWGTGQSKVSLGVFLMRKTTLRQLLAGEYSCDMRHFITQILKPNLDRLQVAAYCHDGYFARIVSPETFFHYNMDMLDSTKKRRLFFYEGRGIYTNSRDSLPTRYGPAARVTNTIIADGCEIYGTVENCVIFRNVKVKAGAVVKNSILQGDTVVENGAFLDWIVTDNGVIVTEDRRLMGYKTYPVYIRRDTIV
jgi:glucose-1-phosphate adenylyltransferase